MRSTSGTLGLWAAAGLLVTTAHVAAVVLAMRQHEPLLPEAPDAIEIELAPPEMPTSPAVEPSPSELEPAEPEAAPEPEPEPEPEPDFVPPPVAPPPDIADWTPPPPDFLLPPVVTKPPEEFVSIPHPPVTRPKERPERIIEMARAAEAAEPDEPERPREERRREPEKPKPEKKKPAQPRAETRAERQPARETGASQPASQASEGRRGGQTGAPAQASAASKASWAKTAGARITAHMRRTRLPGGGGGTFSLVVTVTVQPDGRAVGQLARGTGDARVDSALQRQAARIPRLPPPPDGRPFTFSQPITIQMR